MKLKDLTQNVNIVSSHADADMEIRGVAYDSRNVLAGELFVAVKGFSSDGHDFIDDVLEKGAACIISEMPLDDSIPHIVTGSSRKALAAVAAAWFDFPARKISVVGVTGTNGKTSVTNLIKHIIESCTGNKVGLIGTNGNFIGGRELPTQLTTPESYEMQKILEKMVLEGCSHVVMEVSSHALALDRVHGIEFEVGVFTNLSPDHLDFHGTMDEYAKAKALLFPMCKNSAINIDDSYSDVMLNACAGNTMTYGIDNGNADLVGKDVRLYADKSKFTALLDTKICRAEINIPGLFSVYNALSAIAAAALLGFDITDTAPTLLSCGAIKGRAEVMPLGKEYTVIIDYAHTPDALENIITAVRETAKGKVYTLFGCGGDRDKAKRPLMGKIATLLSDEVVITTDNPRTEEPESIINEIVSGIGETDTPFSVIVNRKEAICETLDKLGVSDVLILAGKGHETYQIIGTTKIDFDDREVVIGHLKSKRIESRKIVVEDLD
ncbi:MAG: UDP-N-acetylmuramoyl-L-alanyl-D-glutamate--2,6-diaminopimelate ligase [Oscillospiraceae bacterium]|nr:UDP-N-acetylmuramoyl-L-alanyl-D-glutamate--2,6-diaminopimelate ligase [Oscillospiraceae bacterium]MCL2278085.1 UDP-N-acetylmuramoyl-L-alanyl-D-glutamate--2,6-diaminopimelate ligase [Oscillospiraceae bacterium]